MYTIREMYRPSQQVLERFLYEAIFQREGDALLPRSIIGEPELYRYVQDFGRVGDVCLVAEEGAMIIGAVWARLWTDDDHGFGYHDIQTPELALAVLKGFRGKGVGTHLMRTLIDLLARQGFHHVSLSVQRDNPAVALYRHLGFTILREDGDDVVMIRQLGVPDEVLYSGMCMPNPTWERNE